LRAPRNPLVGIVPGLEFTAGSCKFPPRCLCVFFTDGVTEAEDATGALFSEDALRSIVCRHETGGVDCVDTIVAAVDRFAGAYPQADDITLLAIRRVD
jgi:phosphoserine phosphatase RsbU/P